MAQTFSYEFLATGAPEEARTRLEDAVTGCLRRPIDGGATAGMHRQMRLARHTATTLSYRPRLVVPLPLSLAVWLSRMMRGEHIELTFGRGGSGGATSVLVAGKLGRGTEALGDRELWAGVLGPGLRPLQQGRPI